MATSSSAGSSRARVVISIGLVILLLFLGGAASAMLASLRETAGVRDPEPRRYNVEVFDARPAALQELVAAFGTAQPDKSVVVSAQVSGEIVEIHPGLKVGTLVRAEDATSKTSGESVRSDGDTLVVIDPRTYEEQLIQVDSRIAEARAELSRVDQEEQNLARLQAQLEKDVGDLENEFAKIQQLASRQIATDSDVRRSQIELRSAQTLLVRNENEKDLVPARREQIVRRIASLQNDQQLARLNRDRTTVRPPFTGRLSEVHVEQGQYVKAGDPLVTLTDSSLVEVPLSVSLDDYAKLVPAILAGRFPLVALAESETAERRWHGALTRVSPEADERTRTVVVYAMVDNRQQSSPLLPGMFVHAQIEGPVLENVLVVPRDAVLNGRGFVLRDGHAIRRDVDVERTLHQLALIDHGFEPGDQVILSNLDVLYDGAPVSALAELNLATELQKQASPLARLLESPPSEQAAPTPK